ncbi:MAG: alpha/beta fold hydrolase [Sphingomonadales bacterium]|nr:alpha/beta fold hydrolase [Sphingomonadales bacterium]
MFVNLGDAKIFVDTVGSQLQPCGNHMVERPVLIALHGGPGFDHSPMRPYFDRFADTHQGLDRDLRGNGRASGAPETWTLKRWGQDIKQVCDFLGIERPVVLGVSFGGMVAMSYAIQFPEHPSKLILSSTAAKLNLSATYCMMEKMGAKSQKYRGACF